MSRYDLGALQQHFKVRVVGLEVVLVAAEASNDLPRQIATAEHCVVALQDAYSRFIRELILRSAIGNATDANGKRLRPGPLGVMRKTRALDELRHGWPAYYVSLTKSGGKAVPPVKKPRSKRWEPDWHVDYDWTNALAILQPVNSGAISGGLGAGASPAFELRQVRNFAVHRGPTSAQGIANVATQYSLTSWRQPRDVITAPVGGGAAGLFSNWCARLRAVSRAAVR